jgi:predicted kinase
MPRPDDRVLEREHPPDRGEDPAHDASEARRVGPPREGAASAEDLAERQTRLPRGHPSSSCHADGSRRPPPPDLRESEYPLADEEDLSPSTPDQPTVEPLTDAGYADHVRQVQNHLAQARADGLATDNQHTIDPRHELWSKERRLVHKQIIGDIYARAQQVPNNHQAIIAGGLPGAGKTTVLERHAGIDRSCYLTIDPDQIKEEMAQRELIPQVEGLTPMEASDLVHEESSHVAKLLAFRAQADGKNLIWDITMASRSSTQDRMDDLHAAGYTSVTGIFVDIPLETSELRVQNRHRSELEAFRVGKGTGGRLVPPEVTRHQADPVWGSANRKTFEELKHSFDSWLIYDNSLDGRSPVLIDSSEVKARQT